MTMRWKTFKGEFDVLTQQIQLFDKVDTEGVEPMVYPFEEETSFLREDEVTHVLTQEGAAQRGQRTRGTRACAEGGEVR